jgi:phage terminase large subunit-like protein
VRFDRWRINDLERALERIGAQVPLAPHGQGYKDMSGALDQFEALALNGRLRHGSHPLLTWCAANAIVTKDAAGNRKLDRSRATGRIDGLVAAVMAVAAMSGASEPAMPAYQMFILR